MHSIVGRRAATAATRRRVAIIARPTRHFSTSTAACNKDKTTQSAHVDVEDLLSKPTWSVASLLPPKGEPAGLSEVSPKQLHHLLRLSALPPPKNAEEEAKMLSTLSSQLHFVKEIQKVDITGVEPLRSLRDETSEGETEAELGMEALKDALAQEEVRGRFHKRIRRRRDMGAVKKEEEDWDVLGTAEKRVGRFFVVEGGMGG